MSAGGTVLPTSLLVKTTNILELIVLVVIDDVLSKTCDTVHSHQSCMVSPNWSDVV